MFQNNLLLSQLKQQLHEQTPRVEGLVRAHEKGFGFLDVDNKTSYFIPVSKMKSVCNGDKVSGTILMNNDKESFEPETLIETALKKFIAKVGFKDRTMVLYPENFSANFAIRCKVNSLVSERLKDGDIVVATLIAHPLEQGKNIFFAEVTQFVAESSSPYQLWLKTLIRYNLETLPPQSEILDIDPNEAENREDLTHIPFFTIDSEHTQDMDDAIAISKNENGSYKLWVAIADPTAYVLPNSHLDSIAKIRNFTTYLPDFNVPMLPKELANELCSLKANQKRTAMVCNVTIDGEGNMSDDVSFTSAWIESKAKLSYHNVSDYLEKNSSLLVDNATLPLQLTTLSELAKIRLNWRKKNALMFKDNGDYRFILNENRQVKAIIRDSRRIAHHMIEEVMILANLALTTVLKDKIGFGIFNVHNGFDSKYLDQILAILKSKGINDFDKEQLSSFEGYIQLRKIIDEDDYLSLRLRKFQMPADFSTEPQPHFSLGFDAYATWTSPIRKYGDMINHRLIKALIRSNPLDEPQKEQLKLMNERRKMLRFADRDIAETLYAQYLASKIGEGFEAEIIDINRGGARVRLTDIGAFAFMPLSMIHSVREEITSSPEEACIKINDKICLQLADKVKVTLNEVNMDTQNMIVKRFTD